MRAAIIVFMSLLSVVAGAAKPQQQVRLTVTNLASGLQDETTIFFDSTGTAPFSIFEDLGKVFNPNQTFPQIYSLSSDSVACYSNAYGVFTGPVSIAIGVRLDSVGYYGISASQISYFDAASMVLLEDRQTGNFYNMRTSSCPLYNNQPQFVIGRFVLHISYPPAITLTDADCDNLNGAVNVYQEPTIKWTGCVVYDSVGYVMGSFTNINGNFSFSSLPQGDYRVEFTYGDYVTSKFVYVRGHKIEVTASADPYLATVGLPIQFYTASTNASIFDWSFGEGTLISGVANPEMTYYQPGAFMVVVECSNQWGCYAADTLIVKVSPATGIQETAKESVKVFGSKKNIVIENLSAGSTNWLVSNLIGERVAEGKTTASTETIALNDQPDGVYIVSLNGPTGRLSRKIILKD